MVEARLSLFYETVWQLTPIREANINLVGREDEGSSKVMVYYKGGEDHNEYFIPLTIPTMAPIANVHTALELLFQVHLLKLV